MNSRSQQQGIALVITLIMLSVTLVMAVAFLAISTRERGSVGTSTDANHSREATEAALASAEAQIIASVLPNNSTNNGYNFGMFVSTNYLQQGGFLTGIGSPTNVNYYYPNGSFLNASDYLTNIANLQYLPRAPVFVPNNNLIGGYDFRYYLDLNRNGQFDGNNNVSNFIYFYSNNTWTNAGPITEVGDPEWIGVLEHPDQPHGPLNHFIARYAFIAVPVGNTLDANAIYNDALAPDSGHVINMQLGYDGFLRNEGVGTWELNLASFLADLNTNEWDANDSGGYYNYQSPLGGQNTGAAFEDALSILRYRYDYNIHNQLSVFQLYGPLPYTYNYLNNGIDNYSAGQLMTNSLLPAPIYNNSFYYRRPWAGAPNTNLFFSLSDFFNPAIFRPASYGIPATTPVFTDRLLHRGQTFMVPHWRAAAAT